ncbi:MAG TPA: phosphoribosylanthranilate isomerase [Methanosarcinales archaeon]|nr:phosphoribosylanthranilate isomerase [Methanosarcinales archaeon]
MRSRTRIKICGNTNPYDLNHAISCGADAVGFITDVPVRSPRKIDAKTAKQLIEQVPVLVDSVLVIMPKDLDSAMTLITETAPTCVQIHNDLPNNELAIIAKTVKLIKTIVIPKDASSEIVDPVVSRIRELTGIADAILLDTGTSSGSGGTGTVHNWQISAEIVRRCKVPVILAGGLTPDNVADAIWHVRPYAVDTASGVETGGARDSERVRLFIKRCMEADMVIDHD